MKMSVKVEFIIFFQPNFSSVLKKSNEKFLTRHRSFNVINTKAYISIVFIVKQTLQRLLKGLLITSRLLQIQWITVHDFLTELYFNLVYFVENADVLHKVTSLNTHHCGSILQFKITTLIEDHVTYLFFQSFIFMNSFLRFFEDLNYEDIFPFCFCL